MKHQKQPQKIKHEKDPGFICSHCGKWVPITKRMGTQNRNHCPVCLWSAHVDERPGDRKSHCGGQMEPIGLTFKKAGVDKYGKERQGELMLIHRCQRCWKLSINRIAADDAVEKIENTYSASLELSPDIMEEVSKSGIFIAGQTEKDLVHGQLYGKTS